MVVVMKLKMMPLKMKMRAEIQVVTMKKRRQKVTPTKVRLLQTRVTMCPTSQQMRIFRKLT